MLKKCWDWVSALSGAWGLLPSTLTTYVATVFWVAAMTVFGYLENVPVFWIMMGLPLAAASIFTLALRAAEWRTRMSAAGKLEIKAVNLGGDYIKNKNGKVVSIENAQVRLILQSSAPFPISFIVDEIQTSFEGKYPPNKQRLNNGGVALVNELKGYSDHLIEMNEPIKQKVEGTIKYKIRYGHKGREKYPLEANLKFGATFDEKAGGYVVYMQQDVA